MPTFPNLRSIDYIEMHLSMAEQHIKAAQEIAAQKLGKSRFSALAVKLDEELSAVRRERKGG